MLDAGIPTTKIETSDNKQEKVYELIRNSILHNEFPANTILVERKLSELYGISRSPIRNALQRLVSEGLLVSISGKGTVIPELNLEDIIEVFDLLEIFQLHSAKICINKSTPTMQRALGIIIENMENAILDDDIKAAAKYDSKFHEFIVMQTSNKRLQNFFSQLKHHHSRFLASSANDMPLYIRACAEHKLIYKALLSQDPAQMEIAIRNHYDSLRKHYINVLLFEG